MSLVFLLELWWKLAYHYFQIKLEEISSVNWVYSHTRRQWFHNLVQNRLFWPIRESMIFNIPVFLHYCYVSSSWLGHLSFFLLFLEHLRTVWRTSFHNERYPNIHPISTLRLYFGLVVKCRTNNPSSYQHCTPALQHALPPHLWWHRWKLSLDCLERKERQMITELPMQLYKTNIHLHDSFLNTT